MSELVELVKQGRDRVINPTMDLILRMPAILHSREIGTAQKAILDRVNAYDIKQHEHLGLGWIFERFGTETGSIFDLPLLLETFKGRPAKCIDILKDFASSVFTAMNLARVIIHNYTVVFDIDGQNRDDEIGGYIQTLNEFLPIFDIFVESFKTEHLEIWNGLIHKLSESYDRQYSSGIEQSFQGKGNDYFDGLEGKALKAAMYTCDLYAAANAGKYFSLLSSDEWKTAVVSDRRGSRPDIIKG